LRLTALFENSAALALQETHSCGLFVIDSMEGESSATPCEVQDGATVSAIKDRASIVHRSRNRYSLVDKE
jgi:hypothetical protein